VRLMLRVKHAKGNQSQFAEVRREKRFSHVGGEKKKKKKK